MYPRGLCAGATAGYAVLMGEIRVQVKLSNIADPSRRATAEMLVDTGATRVSLPSGLVRRLGLRKVAETQVEYADRQIGRASCRERGGNAVVDVRATKKKRERLTRRRD